MYSFFAISSELMLSDLSSPPLCAADAEGHGAQQEDSGGGAAEDLGGEECVGTHMLEPGACCENYSLM